MTYRVKVSADHVCEEVKVFDLDEFDELDQYLDYILFCADFDLYEGERVVIECIERDDQ